MDKQRERIFFFLCRCSEFRVELIAEHGHHVSRTRCEVVENVKELRDLEFKTRSRFYEAKTNWTSQMPRLTSFLRDELQ